jgi:PIN domain nuclease of toxin-antitoxin system
MKMAIWHALAAALPIKIVAADSAIAHRAARLSSATRQAGLSLGDCFCLATAQHLGAAAMTADRAWSRLRLGIPVTVIR